jgi:hypothetical protein
MPLAAPRGTEARPWGKPDNTNATAKWKQQSSWNQKHGFKVNDAGINKGAAPGGTADPTPKFGAWPTEPWWCKCGWVIHQATEHSGGRCWDTYGHREEGSCGVEGAPTHSEFMHRNERASHKRNVGNTTFWRPITQEDLAEITKCKLHKAKCKPGPPSNAPWWKSDWCFSETSYETWIGWNTYFKSVFDASDAAYHANTGAAVAAQPFNAFQRGKSLEQRDKEGPSLVKLAATNLQGTEQGGGHPRGV